MARGGAEQADREALAEGKPDPGTKAVDRANQAIFESRRRLEALTIAVERAHGELCETVEAHRGALRAKAERAVSHRRSDALRTLEALAGALHELREVVATDRWLAESTDRARYNPATGLGVVPALLKRSGDPYGSAEVIEALRSLIEPPPVQKAEPAPLRPVSRAA